MKTIEVWIGVLPVIAAGNQDESLIVARIVDRKIVDSRDDTANILASLRLVPTIGTSPVIMAYRNEALGEWAIAGNEAQQLFVTTRWAGISWIPYTISIPD